jgi:hypothetical protein
MAMGNQVAPSGETYACMEYKKTLGIKRCQTRTQCDDSINIHQQWGYSNTAWESNTPNT